MVTISHLFSHMALFSSANLMATKLSGVAVQGEGFPPTASYYHLITRSNVKWKILIKIQTFTQQDSKITTEVTQILRPEVL